MFYHHGMGVGAWIFMVLALIAFWGLIAAAVVWVARDLRSRPHRHAVADGVSATELLDRRLVTGEIGVEEYERLRAARRGRASDTATDATG
jgi:putative membrane protein